MNNHYLTRIFDRKRPYNICYMVSFYLFFYWRILSHMLILYACWKIGCFSNNCCVGINNFPIQIIESIICIILYYIIRISKIRKKISIICIIFGITRIVTFLLRNKISFNNLIINEVISICILLIGIKTTINKERRVI